MTRFEQIKNAAHEYVVSNYCYSEEAMKQISEDFIAGAKWSDDNLDYEEPIEIIKQIILDSIDSDDKTFIEGYMSGLNRVLTTFEHLHKNMRN